MVVGVGVGCDPGTIVCDVTVLAPGATSVCTATRTVVQGDMDAGEVVNDATGSGIDPSGVGVVDVSNVVTCRRCSWCRW